MIWLEPSAYLLRVVDRPPGELPPYRVLGTIMAPSDDIAILVGLHGRVRPAEIRQFLVEMRLLGFEWLLARRVNGHGLPYAEPMAGDIWDGWLGIDLGRFDEVVKVKMTAANDLTQ